MSVHVDESDYCTFKPVINEPKPVVVIQQKRAIVKQKPKSAHAEPIHERLYNKGKEYRNALEDKQKVNISVLSLLFSYLALTALLPS